MTNQGSEGRHDGPNKPYDVEERTALFGEAITDYAKKRQRICIKSLRRSTGGKFYGLRIFGFGLLSDFRLRRSGYGVTRGCFVIRHSGRIGSPKQVPSPESALFIPQV